MARALQCMDLHAIKLATSARYALLSIPPPFRPLRCVWGLPKPFPPPLPWPGIGFRQRQPGCRIGRADRGWNRGPTTPGPNPPGRFGYAAHFRLLSLCTSGVRCSTLPMCTHVHAYYLLYRIVPGRTLLLALEACGNSRSMAPISQSLWSQMYHCGGSFLVAPVWPSIYTQEFKSPALRQ